MKKYFLAFILACVTFGGVFADLHKDFTGKYAEKNKEKLIALYEDYLNWQPDDACALDYFKRSLKLFKELIPHLDIELSINEIEAAYSNYGVILFRKIDKKVRSLLIGCGNKPCSDDGGYIMHRLLENDSDHLDYQRQKRYRKEHVHDGFITIDPDFAKNPTIVAYFGHRELTLFSDHHFDKIVVEGIYIAQLSAGESELKRLLSKNGKLYEAGAGDLTTIGTSVDKLAKEAENHFSRFWKESEPKESVGDDFFLKCEKNMTDGAVRLFYRMLHSCFPEHVGYKALKNKFIKGRATYGDGGKIFDTIYLKVAESKELTHQERWLVFGVACLLGVNWQKYAA